MMGQGEIRHNRVAVLIEKVKGLSVLLKMPVLDSDIP